MDYEQYTVVYCSYCYNYCVYFPPNICDWPSVGQELVENMFPKNNQKCLAKNAYIFEWLPLLSARPAVTLATLKRAATSFTGW